VGGFFSFNNQSKKVFEKCGFEYQVTITKEVLNETRETLMVALFNN